MRKIESALRTEGLGLRIGGADILTDVSLDLRPGELVGLIGPNGAGKTSFINVVTGVMRATSGAVLIGETDVTRYPVHRRAALGVGRTFQTSNLLDGLSVVENVALARERPGSGLLRNLVRRAASHAEDLTCLERVGLAGKAQARTADLSHGERRKLELAVLIATRAEVMLLDEPMAGVNSDDVPGLVELIEQVHRETGAATLLVEHHLDVVLQLADRLAVLHHGRLLALDEPQAVMANETVQAAYVGEPL